ncbi:MAG: HAMP domain-containing protein, partial [Candidatus Heimdallarchaeaceae archaeon]
MKRVSIARRWVLSTIFFLILTLLLVITTNSFIMELRIQAIKDDATEKYLDAEIESMELSSYQFVHSFDSLIGNNILNLNSTSAFITHQLFSETATKEFTYSSLNFNGSDETFYLNGFINASVRREKNIGYLDYYNDGRNVFDTPGMTLFGDIKNQLTISGGVYLQINASIEGQLSESGSISVYYSINNTVAKLDITDLYKEKYNESFSNEFLVQWNNNSDLIPSEIRSSLNISDIDNFETFFLILDDNVSNLKIIANTAKSRATGCINGSIVGNYKGILKGNIAGSVNGEIDLRPGLIYNYFPSLLNSYLQWVYFATPDYFIIFPYAPDFRYEQSVSLPADFDWLKRPWYSEILEQESQEEKKGVYSHFSSLGVDYAFGNLFISLGRAIYNSTGIYQGLLVLDFNLEYLKHTLELNITEQDFNWLVDVNGDIIFSPEYFLKEPKEVKKPFPVVNIADLNNSLLYSCYLNVSMGITGHLNDVYFNQTNYIVFFRPLESLDWYIFHFSPEELVLQDFQPVLEALNKHLRRVELILMFSSFIIIGVVGIAEIIMINNFKNQLLKLREAIYSVSEGDFSVSFEINREKMDELTEVLFLFEEMAFKLDGAIQREKESSVLATLALDLFVHDMGNYMHAIRGYTELVSISNLPSEYKDIIDKIVNITNKAELLRKKIMLLKLVSKEPLPPEEKKLSEVIEQA